MNKDYSLSAKLFVKYIQPDELLSRGEIVYGLQYLSKVLNAYYGEKVYILIDEYDVPTSNTIRNTKFLEGNIKIAHNLLQEFMGASIKGNEYVERSLVTACVRLAGARSGASRSVMKTYPFLHKHFEGYFGFTTAEVNDLLEFPEFQWLTDVRTEIDRWYNGYILSNGVDSIYSSWDILNLLEDSLTIDKKQENWKEQLFRSYWIQTDFLDKLDDIFAITVMRHAVETLIHHEKIRIVTKEVTVADVVDLTSLVDLQINESTIPQRDLFLQFLADSGYFRSFFVKTGGGQDVCDVMIPNWEIKAYLIVKCYNAYLFIKKYKLNPRNIVTYQDTVLAILSCKAEDGTLFENLTNAVAKLFSDELMKMNFTASSLLYCITEKFLLLVVNYMSKEFQKQWRNKRHPKGDHPDWIF